MDIDQLILKYRKSLILFNGPSIGWGFKIKFKDEYFHVKHPLSTSWQKITEHEIRERTNNLLRESISEEQIIY